MLEHLFEIIYFAGIVAQIIIRAPYGRPQRKIEKTDRRVNSAEQVGLTLLFVGILPFPLLYSLTSWLDFADYPVSANTKVYMGIVGTLLLIVSLWLFWRSHHDLGSNWSPSLEINVKQTLITHGIYRWIRHPMYASQWVWSIAQIFLFPNWIAGWIGLLTFAPFYWIRIAGEEQMMIDHFGAAYREYCAKTGRVIPRMFG